MKYTKLWCLYDMHERLIQLCIEAHTHMVSGEEFLVRLHRFHHNIESVISSVEKETHNVNAGRTT